jgi:hypothetical protein
MSVYGEPHETCHFAPGDRTVRCVDCGYLALRDRSGLQMVEAPQAFRETGGAPTDVNGKLIYESSIPTCTARAADLTREVEPSKTASIILATIKRDRTCRSFVRWMPCFSPRDHKEAADEHDREQRQRQRDEDDRRWRDEQAKQEHNWRVEQAERDRQWRREDLEAMEKRHRTERVYQWAAVVVALLVGIGGIVATIAAN